MCGEPRVAAECTYTGREFGRCSRPTVRPGRNVHDERDHGDGSDTRPRGRRQTARQVPRMQHGQTIRLVEVRGDLGEPAVRSVADGTRDVIAHGVTEALLDLVREGRIVSIRAPRAGGDQAHLGVIAPSQCFNPRPPRGGRPPSRRRSRSYGLVSIRAPPRGGRPAGEESAARLVVSIRAPRAGGD